jgi:hypothetical protein
VHRQKIETRKEHEPSPSPPVTSQHSGSSLMKSLSESRRRRIAAAAIALLLLGVVSIQAATPYVMSGGNYSENFADIANWTANFANGIGAAPYGSVAVNATGTIPDGKRTTVSTATFTTGSSGGVQKGTQALLFLSTGNDNANACAVDLFLDFTGRDAESLSFDWAEVNNSTGDRASSLRVYTSIDGTIFTELTGAIITVTNNVAFSGTKSSITLPSAFNGSSTARIRFYSHTGTGGITPTGSRPKILIDNIVVTSTSGCASPSPAIPTASPSTTVCAGTPVILTESASDGTAPYTYQWKKDGVVIPGATFSTYTNLSPVAGDSGNYTCDVTSQCGGTAATSPALALTVTALVTPAVGISANPGTTTCGGNTVIFTATPTNGGATPHFQWKLNGNDVGVDSASYTNNALLNGDQVSVVLTTSVACATAPTATSATLTMNITASVTPAVSISASPGTNICAGTTVIFTATPVNGGSSPLYIWKTNGVHDTSVPNSSATYTNSTLANGSTVDCQLISNDPCAAPTTADATPLTFTVNPTLVPSVSVSPDVGTVICAGTTVIFTATPVNGGVSPAYQWKTNGVNVGLNTASYTNAALINGTIVTVVLTPSAEICASPATATSSDITMTVNASPSLTGPTNASRCEGAAATFTVTAAGLGPFTYQWKKDGVNITDATNASYTIASVTATDYANTPGYQCLVTSNDSGCSTLSAAATLTSATAPTLTGPSSATKCVGQSVTFGIGATGTLVYQWRKNGTPIIGATTSNYTISAIAPGDAGDYDCMVTNTTTGCWIGSSTATLTIGTGCTISSVVIVEVYGGGGNSGATYRNDFIGLFNRGCDAVNLSGWSVQYASAAGTTWSVTPLSGSIPPGGYYLVQEAQGTGGTTSLPTPDATGTIAMAAGEFKVALVSSTTALIGACPSSSSIVDLIGLGSAGCSETATAPAAGNTVSAQRKNGGCTDTDNNSSDFATAAPNPRNSSTTPTPCATKPTATVRGSDSTTICSNSVATITADLTGIAPFTVTWSDGTTTTTHTSVSGPTDSLLVSPTSTKTYTITAVTDSGACPNGTGTFSATITVDNPPVSPNSTNAVTKNVPLVLSITKLLNKASDPDAGDTLSIVSVTDGSHGTAVITPTNTIAYTPATDYTGPDTFTYTISDGRTCTITPTMAVTVVPPTTNEGFNRVSITTLPNNDVKLIFLGIPGYSYALDWAHELSVSTIWEPLITNQASGTGLLLFTNTPSSPGPDFYRTRYVP